MLAEFTNPNVFKSSANLSFFECKKLRSLKNIKNSKGAKCEPYGTPGGTFNGSKNKFLSFTTCELFNM